MYPTNMSKIEELRVYVNERLRSAAVEILGVMEKTIMDYEDQAVFLKRETDRQRNLLDIVLRPKLPVNGQFQPAATTTHQAEAGFMCQPFPAQNPSPSSEPLCAFTSREDFLKFASVGYCPYCCKSTEASEIHLIRRHYLFAIHFTDKGVEKFTVPCTCKERIKGRSHWHCPDCGKTIYRKNNFEMHLSKQHGHILVPQSQDPETYHAASGAFGDEEEEEEEEGPAEEEWLWPEFNNLDQEEEREEEEEEEPPALSHIKVEQEEPLWIGLEAGREFHVPPQWPCRKPREEPEKLQVKKEEQEERNEWRGGEEEEEDDVVVLGVEPPRGRTQNSMATAAHVKSLHRDSALTSSSSASSSSHFGNVQDKMESAERGAFATTSSSAMPGVGTTHPGGESAGMMVLAGTWQQQQQQNDCSLGDYKDPIDGQAEGGGAWSGSKTPRSKRAKQGKTNGPHAALKWKRPGRFSPSQGSRGPLHRCKLCGKAFHCGVTLVRHAQTHAQDTCVCVVCGKHVESREGLLQHLQTHKDTFNTF